MPAPPPMSAGVRNAVAGFMLWASPFPRNRLPAKQLESRTPPGLGWGSNPAPLTSHSRAPAKAVGLCLQPQPGHGAAAGEHGKSRQGVAPALHRLTRKERNTALQNPHARKHGDDPSGSKYRHGEGQLQIAVRAIANGAVYSQTP